MVLLRWLMLIACAHLPQACLTAAFNAGKDIQQAKDVRVKVPNPSSSRLWVHKCFK